MNNTISTALDSTPVIHSSTIQTQTGFGVYELENGDYYHIVSLITDSGHYVVAGSACNVGLIPEYARAFDPDMESEGEALQELVADLESLDAPSGDLLQWHGSLAI